MSFWDFFSCGDNDNVEKSPAPREKKEQLKMDQKLINIEKQVNKTQSTIKVFQNLISKQQTKLNNLKQNAKELMKLNKIKQAQGMIKDATRVSQQINAYSKRVQSIKNQLDQLNTAKADIIAIQQLQSGQKQIPNGEQNIERLRILQQKNRQIKDFQQQNKEQYDLLCENEDLQIDMEQMMREMNNEIKKEIKVKQDKNNKGNQKKIQEEEEKDQLEKMLDKI